MADEGRVYENCVALIYNYKKIIYYFERLYMNLKTVCPVKNLHHYNRCANLVQHLDFNLLKTFLALLQKYESEYLAFYMFYIELK